MNKDYIFDVPLLARGSSAEDAKDKLIQMLNEKHVEFDDTCVGEWGDPIEL